MRILILFFVIILTTILYSAEYTVPRAAYAVSAGDLDLDGDNDIVVGHVFNTQTNWGGISILENNGDGFFSMQDSIFLFSSLYNVYALNINEDEFPDLVATHYENETSYISVSEYDEGNYNNYYYEMEYYVDEFVMGDLNNDGDLDIVFRSNNGQFWGYMTNNGHGVFSQPTYYDVDYHPGGIACGDLNNDGLNDVVVCGLNLEIYWKTGNGFDYQLIINDHYQNEVKIEDIDNDGWNDIVVSEYGSPSSAHYLQIYKNNGDADFSLVYDEQLSMGVFNMQLIELNNDGLLDIVYTKDGSPNQVYLRYNNGDTSFSDEESFQTNNDCINCFSADLDGNGWNDIITTHYFHGFLPGNLHILFNDGEGNFVEEPQVGINEEFITQNSELVICNYPNPFNPVTNIAFSTKEEGRVILDIYNLRGQKVRTLVNDIYEQGNHSIEWNGQDDNSTDVSSGVYFCKMTTDRYTSTKKMLLLK